MKAVVKMKSNKKHLTLRIAELKEAIRRKYNSFKTGAIESERLLEKKYKPIINEIKKKTNIYDEPRLNIKKEESEEQGEEEELERKLEEEGDDEDEVGDGFSSPLPVSSTLVTHGDDEQLDSLLSTPSGRETISQFISEHFNHPLSEKYMTLFMRDRGGKSSMVDHLYGPRFEGDTLMIGNSKLELSDDGSILIKNVRYKPTEGLYELLFKRVPDQATYDDNDLMAYKNILELSNAHKKEYNYKGNINRNNSLKYKRVIGDLFPPVKKRGSGMQWKSSVSRDIMFWDDPNELVERLRLLSMSVETGNNSHTNEIINIVEELREAGFIKGQGNTRFKALLK